jgi:hypothetical protein
VRVLVDSADETGLASYLGCLWWRVESSTILRLLLLYPLLLLTPPLPLEEYDSVLLLLDGL